MAESNFFWTIWPYVTNGVALVLLFTFLAIWLKTLIRGFGVLALAEACMLLFTLIHSVANQFGLVSWESGSQLLYIGWIVANSLRVIGAVLLYRHFKSLATNEPPLSS